MQQTIPLRGSCVAIALDLKQAKILVSSKCSPDYFLACTPDAHSYLLGTGKSVLSIEDAMTTFSHARLLVLMDRNLKTVEQQLSETSCDPLLQNILSIFAFYVLSPVLLLMHVIGRLQCSEIISVAKLKLVKTSNVNEFVVAMREELHPEVSSFVLTGYGHINAKFVRWLNRFTLPLLKRKLVIAHADHANPVPKFVSNILLENVNTAVRIQSKPPRASIFESIAKVLKNVYRLASNGRDIVIFRGNTEYLAPETIKLDLGNPGLNVVLNTALNRHAIIAAQEISAGEAFAKQVHIDVLMMDNLTFPASQAAARRVKKNGGKVVMVNHGSHTVPDGALSKLASNVWARQGRVCNSYVTDAICKGPATEELMGIIGDWKPRVHQLQTYSTVKRIPDTTKFRILVAGNFSNVRAYVPWATELTGEYQKSILRFVDSLSGLKGIEVTVRVKKGKPGLDVQDLLSNLPKSTAGFQVIVDSAGSMEAALSKSDLVVSNLSSAIEEALASGIPVLLNTYRQSYYHFPAMLNCPTKTSRSAVYGTSKVVNEAKLVSAIRNAHQTPLTPSELEKYVWTEDIKTSQNRFVQSIYSNGARKNAANFS